MMCFSLKRRASFKHQNLQKCSKRSMFWTRKLPNVLFATALYNFSTSGLQKVLRGLQFFRILTLECAFRHSRVHFSNIRTKVVQTRHALYILTSECAFRHSRVHFSNIRTYKSGPNTSCFVHFDFRICFSPQRRAIFDVSSEHLPPHPPL